VDPKPRVKPINLIRGGLVRPAILTTLLAAAVLFGVFRSNDGAENVALSSGSVQVSGSETMRPVVTACAADFMIRNPKADVIVKGGGSGDGIAALLHGMVDVGMTSRELSRRERDYAISKGIEIAVFELARDGIAIVVNRANTSTALDIGQLQKIFSGKIRNWQELGGGDAEIVAFARAEGSGTAALFGERVLGDDTYAASVQRLPDNEAIVAEIAKRSGAIGYTGIGALKGAGDRIKILALRTGSHPSPIAPTYDTIRSGDYPLTRTLYLGTAGKPSGAAKAFLDFCSSASGHALLERAGYVGIARASP
jgi:phosphate transport system substrate-binding protein